MTNKARKKIEPQNQIEKSSGARRSTGDDHDQKHVSSRADKKRERNKKVPFTARRVRQKVFLPENLQAAPRTKEFPFSD